MNRSHTDTRRRRPIWSRVFLATTAALMLLGSAVYAAGGETVLGADGHVYRVLSGSYGELFPEGTEVEAENAVLALDVLRDGVKERFLIPETQSPEVEHGGTLHYEAGGDDVYVLWEGVQNAIHPLLYLTSFHGAGFDNVIGIAGNPFAEKGHPQLVSSRDAEPPIRAMADLGMRGDRAVINVVWWERSNGQTIKRFVPILFQNGAFIGSHPMPVGLGSLLNGTDAGVTFDPRAEDLLRIQKGSKLNTTVIGFFNSATGKLVSIEVELLPMALSFLARQVADEVAEMLGDGQYTAEEIGEAARQVALAAGGSDFHPGSLEFIARRVVELILEESSRPEGLAGDFPDKLGPHIIHIGARFKANGLDGQEAVELIEIGSGLLSVHHLKVVRVAEWQAPDVGDDASLFLSSTGRRAMVAWNGESSVFYRESDPDGGGWGSLHEIRLEGDLDNVTAYRILAERVAGY